MADPEAHYDILNRRMTRSACKRASSSLENGPQQKKLQLSKQKPEALSKKKPGGLSKTHGNQQQLQQQQHNEGNDVTEVSGLLTGEALREYQRVQNKIFRKLTPEERENYCKKVMPSEGFDAVDLPEYIENYGGLIRPVKQSNEEQSVLEICSKSAIAAFNKKNKTKYRFVEVIKANYKLGSEVEEFNFEEYNVMYARKEEDPNKPKKPSPALFWFFQEFTKTYKEKHPNASDDAAEGRVEEEESDNLRKNKKSRRRGVEYVVKIGTRP
ncbi:hypothetical protein RHMOL_Rhmol12G0233500 [Rhododendron molle]|uniref:Uncharacterized protein n=1 Tax=Rhododendron molle TaxID=49168 RepID=A0ACC0LLY9_RHOML|nr:hypothetical protein RHMOL_Rhmol12G0233500 [Rhododendron molle]